MVSVSQVQLVVRRRVGERRLEWSGETKLRIPLREAEPEYGEAGVSEALSMSKEAVEKARKEMELMVVRLADELDRLINMYAWARESLANEMTGGLGSKAGLMDSVVKKLKDLTIGMNSLIESKVKWDKAQKSLAATMTPKEEMDAVFKYIMTLDGESQHTLRDRLNDHGVWKWKS